MGIRRLCLLVAATGMFGSCVGPKKVVYLNHENPQDTRVVTQPTQARADIIIQPDDILSINVTSASSLTPKTGAGGIAVAPADEVDIYNSGGTSFTITATSAGGGGALGSTKGYLVNKQGEINYSVLGRIKLGGLTITQANEAIAQLLRSRLKDPVVETRIINYTVTILGEIGRPGPIIAPNQKISIFEAIAAAGDIPITGRKDNVEIIRQVGDHKEIARLDLNSRQVFNSPYFYLNQNDIIYIEPIRVRRQEANEFLRFYLPVVSSFISVGFTVYYLTQIGK